MYICIYISIYIRYASNSYQDMDGTSFRVFQDEPLAPGYITTSARGGSCVCGVK